METLDVKILEPKAKTLLENLAELNLIQIKPRQFDLERVLADLRRNEAKAPSLEEITAEVEAVRAERYAAGYHAPGHN